jgi:hypothetical protein
MQFFFFFLFPAIFLFFVSGRGMYIYLRQLYLRRFCRLIFWIFRLFGYFDILSVDVWIFRRFGYFDLLSVDLLSVDLLSVDVLRWYRYKMFVFLRYYFDVEVKTAIFLFMKHVPLYNFTEVYICR